MEEILHYSGGIDSTACLWLLRERWDEMTVLWCDTGAAYEETHALMDRVAKLVPHFDVVKSNQPVDIEHNGFPADIVPQRLTKVGRLIHATQGPIFRSYLECCAHNIWFPLMQRTVELGANVVYRGQRSSCKRKAPITTGTVDEQGIEYVFPIEDWTRIEARTYVRNNCSDLIGNYYSQGEDSSHDCWDCTAYLDDNVNRIRHLPTLQRDIVMERLQLLDTTLAADRTPLHEVLYADDD